MSLLVARDLSVIPPGSAEPVVSGISLSVSAGEWLAVTGGNGGGKTSLLLGLAGLWPTRGELLYDGRQLERPGHTHSREVAVVLQDPSTQILQPTVRDELAFAPRNQGLPAGQVTARVKRWSGALGLDPELETDPARLSAGRQQKVLLAAALAAEPRLLLADEPSAHLDAESRRRVLDLMRRRAKEGMAIVWVTQFADELSSADRVLEVGSRSDALPTTSPEGHPLSGAAGRVAGSGLESVRIHVKATRDEPPSGPHVSVREPIEIVIPRRGIAGVVGRNGIGKSAILGAVAGHSPIDQVQSSWSVPTDPGPIATLQYPELQIFEESPAAEVVYAAVARGVPRSEALELARDRLRDLGMDGTGLLERRTWILSTGEKRVLEVVSALIAPACLYVLDEPSAGLDPRRKELLGGLISGRAETKPVLIATQDVDWLRGLGSLIFDLDSGSSGPQNPALT